MGLEARATVPAAPTKPTVVLACSTADAVALPRVLKRLVDVGVRVDVCAGVELDARPLQRALARGNTRTSYAICRSRELDGDQLDRLYRLACDAGIPNDRLAVLRFEVERPDELTGALLQRLADHGFADVAGAPVALSSDDVTEPVMIIPREPNVTRMAERSAAVLHLVPTPSPTPPSIAAPRRSRFALGLGCTLALAAIAVLVLGWLSRIG
ncbi:MAG: hypothetical protein IAG13_10940, partial [Deltaproteobacteria bacterium]|nr:hypothetical protein [Nannocystaceae bacterium]